MTEAIGTTNPFGFGGMYNVNPSPQPGQGAYGKVPGAIGLPPSMYQQAIGSVPGLAGNATLASGDVNSLLSGNLSQGTENYIDRLVAAKGVNSGVLGSPFNTADLVTSLGLTSEQLVNSGLSAYNSLLSTVGGLQENPALMADIAQSNATLAAAPNPQDAAQQLIQDMQNEFGFGYGKSPAGYGSTHILGPKIPPPSYTGGFNSPIGSPDQPTGVFMGGPGFNTTTSNPVDPFTAWVQNTFGNTQFGNPAPAGGTGTMSPDFGMDPLALLSGEDPTSYLSDASVGFTF